MQVFKSFLKSTLKFMPQTIMYFVIFISIGLLVSNSQSDPETSGFRTESLDMGIIDEDESEASAKLFQYLNTMHTVTSVQYDKNTLLDRLFYRDMDYILILPKGFEERLSRGETDSLFETLQIPGLYSSTFIDEQINTYLKTVKLYLAGGSTLTSALEHTGQTLAESSNQVRILNPDGKENAADQTGLYYFYKFMPYVLMSMILSGLTPILTLFWEKNLSKRISCSSESLISRNLQLALGSIVYCLGIWIFFLLATGFYDKTALFSKQCLFSAANSFLIMPASIGFSLIISCFSPSSNAVSMLNNIISLGMSFLCGIFVPQQMMGENVLAVSKFLPFYWYVKNNDMIFGFSDENFLPDTFWKYFGIQVLFAVAIFAVALVLTKYKNARHQA